MGHYFLVVRASTLRTKSLGKTEETLTNMETRQRQREMIP